MIGTLTTNIDIGLIPCRDSSNLCADIASYTTVTLNSCNFDGNVTCATHVVATGCIFTDTGNEIFGFIEEFPTKPIMENFTRSRQGTNSIPTNNVKNRVIRNEIYKKGFSVEKVNESSGQLANNTLEDIFEIALPDNYAIAVKLSYYVFGPAAVTTNRLMERGEFFITAVSDSGGVINTDITKGTFSQALNGYTSLVVDGTATGDAANDKVIIAMRQVSNVGGFQRMNFTVDLVSVISSNVQTQMTTDPITFLAF